MNISTINSLIKGGTQNIDVTSRVIEIKFDNDIKDISKYFT